MRPSRDVWMMEMADVVRQRATCSRNHVGAVISVQGRVISSGYNGAPAGLPHCDHTCDCGRESGTHMGHLRECASTSPCLVSVHAEANAIAFAARHGQRTEGASMYTTVSPCLPCAQLIINCGIVRVIYGDLYRVQDGLELLQSAGVDAQSLS